MGVIERRRVKVGPGPRVLMDVPLGPYTVQFSHDNKKWYGMSGPGHRSTENIDEAMEWYNRLATYQGLLQYVRVIGDQQKVVIWCEVK
jgi:hypothetical protein